MGCLRGQWDAVGLGDAVGLRGPHRVQWDAMGFIGVQWG